jgi:hypothetical protein
MSQGTKHEFSRFDSGMLSPLEETVLAFLRDAVAEMRKAKAVDDLSHAEKAIAKAGGFQVAVGTGLKSGTFCLKGTRFTLRLLGGPGDKVEVVFLGGDL